MESTELKCYIPNDTEDTGDCTSDVDGPPCLTNSKLVSKPVARTCYVCRNIFSYNPLPISSPKCLSKIRETLDLMVSANKESTPLTCVSFVFPLSESTFFKVIDSDSGECLQTFDIKSIPHYTQMTINTIDSFVTLTYPSEALQTPADILTNSDQVIASDEDTADVTQNLLLEKPNFTCFLYKCDSYFEASLVISCMFKLWRCSNQNADAILIMPSFKLPEEFNACLRLFVDIREEDSRTGIYFGVPKEKPNLFKLRMNLEKQLVIGITQKTGIPQLRVSRCLGIGLAFGRYIQDSDMTNLQIVSENTSIDEANTLIPGADFVTKALWSPKQSEFELLNIVTDREQFVFFTIVCHLEMNILLTPISLHCMCRARVYRQDETFWIPPDRRPCSEDIQLQLVENVDDEGQLFVNWFIVKNIVSPYSDVMRSLVQPEQESDKQESPNSVIQTEDQLEDDEPLMSGNGSVSKEITDSELMVTWSELISDWLSKSQTLTAEHSSAPLNLCPPVPASPESLTAGPDITKLGILLSRRVRTLVRGGIPETLRAETWPMLTGYQNLDANLIEVYRILVSKPCEFDAAIRRDLPRTFPAHDFFQDRLGQESLFRLNRMYALYDEEVGYCQGVSFIAASLLLHLPEEKAFCVLVKIMSNYGVRQLFMRNCDGLYYSLYQFEQLIKNQLPDIAKAFEDVGIEAHMYASQWLLTLLTAKFPLNLAFHITDIFLCEGILFIFKVMLSLVKISRRDLLGLDFEGTLKYFRVNLPKRFRSPEACTELIKTALATKVSARKMTKYAVDWTTRKNEQVAEQTPLRTLHRESWQLKDQCSRLERENETLADELLTNKTSMHKQMEKIIRHKECKLEDMVESLKIELFAVQKELVEKQEECECMLKEITQVKNIFRSELEKNKTQCQQQLNIIEEYKTITLNLSNQIDEVQKKIHLPTQVVEVLSNCPGNCPTILDSHLPGWRKNENNIILDPIITSNDDEVTLLRYQIKELELQLAQKKIEFVDEQCHRQDLAHQLQKVNFQLERCQNELDVAKNINAKQWFAKKWTNIRSTTTDLTSNHKNNV